MVRPLPVLPIARDHAGAGSCIWLMRSYHSMLCVGATHTSCPVCCSLPERPCNREHGRMSAVCRPLGSQWYRQPHAYVAEGCLWKESPHATLILVFLAGILTVLLGLFCNQKRGHVMLRLACSVWDPLYILVAEQCEAFEYSLRQRTCLFSEAVARLHVPCGCPECAAKHGTSACMCTNTLWDFTRAPQHCKQESIHRLPLTVDLSGGIMTLSKHALSLLQDVTGGDPALAGNRAA